MSIDLEIEGVSDRAVTEAIRKRVRLLRHHPDPEDWRVRLVRSENEAEWDLGIRTASGWHVASFTAPAQVGRHRRATPPRAIGRDRRGRFGGWNMRRVCIR